MFDYTVDGNVVTMLTDVLVPSALSGGGVGGGRGGEGGGGGGGDSLAPRTMSVCSLPTQRLRRVMKDPSKTPLCLVACGSFSPITYLHLRMFEMAADFVRFNTDFEIVAGYLSPVSDAYKKTGLVSAKHRSVSP